MTKHLEMYDDFETVVTGESTASKQALLKVLKKHSETISVFDLMLISADMHHESRYVQRKYREETNKVYVKYFLCRVKEICDNKKYYDGNIDKNEFIEAIAKLQDYQKNESSELKSKFSLLYSIVSLYTTFILEEPIHPVGTLFPGSLKVEEKNGIYYCPVKEANIDSPNAVCKLCIAEQLDF